MGYFISCFNDEGKLVHYEVPKEIARYIQQIEAYIKYPNESKLLEHYNFRFKS